MIDFNRKLSYERETHRMSILVLLKTLIFIKKCWCQFHAILCTVSNTTTGPDSKLNLTAIGISTLYALMDSSFKFWFETINLRRSIVYIKGSQVIISKQKYISFSKDVFMS